MNNLNDYIRDEEYTLNIRIHDICFLKQLYQNFVNHIKKLTKGFSFDLMINPSRYFLKTSQKVLINDFNNTFVIPNQYYISSELRNNLDLFKIKIYRYGDPNYKIVQFKLIKHVSINNNLLYVKIIYDDPIYIYGLELFVSDFNGNIYLNEAYYILSLFDFNFNLINKFYTIFMFSLYGIPDHKYIRYLMRIFNIKNQKLHITKTDIIRICYDKYNSLDMFNLYNRLNIAVRFFNNIL